MAEQTRIPPTPRTWREPTRLLTLRWGSYRARYLAAVALIFIGGALIQATSAYSMYLLYAGMAAHLVGWWIVPGRGWRRFWMSLLSASVMMVLLTGGPSSAALVIPLAGWLYVRQRPVRCYPVIVTPFIAGVILGQVFPQYGSGVYVIAIAGLVLIGTVWLARLIANSGRTSSHDPASAR